MLHTRELVASFPKAAAMMSGRCCPMPTEVPSALGQLRQLQQFQLHDPSHLNAALTGGNYTSTARTTNARCRGLAIAATGIDSAYLSSSIFSCDPETPRRTVDVRKARLLRAALR